MIETGERGRMHADEDETAKMAVEEEEEEEEGQEEEEEGGREEKAKAGPPLFPASQPVLCPKHHYLLGGAK